MIADLRKLKTLSKKYADDLDLSALLNSAADEVRFIQQIDEGGTPAHQTRARAIERLNGFESMIVQRGIAL